MSAPDLAGAPGRCCVCGAPHRTCLCQRCYEAYAPDGVKPAWLLALQNDALRLTKREERNRQRLTRQDDARHKQSGRPLAQGVRFQRLGSDW